MMQQPCITTIEIWSHLTHLKTSTWKAVFTVFTKKVEFLVHVFINLHRRQDQKNTPQKILCSFTVASIVWRLL